jgi:hypothetical protein
MIEPIAGNMNFVRASVPFMKRLRELCTQHGALLVFDEVMTGFRVALGGAQSVYAKLIPGFKPDMSVFGKVIGGGMPLAAFGGTRDVMSSWRRWARSTRPARSAATRWPRPAAWPRCARSAKPGFFEALRGAHASLVDGLAAAARDAGVPLVGDSEGGMFGFFFADRAAAELRRRDGHRQGALQPLLPRHARPRRVPGAGAVRRPASSAPRTAPLKVTSGSARSRAMHIHILGICGTFMGGLAALAREAGHRVTGCDAGVYPPMSDQLRALGIDLIEGFGADQLALARHVRHRQRGQARQPADGGRARCRRALHQRPAVAGRTCAAGRHVLAVAGTHGKTTTTAMLAWILDQAGLQPGFLVGGVPLNFGVSARLGAPGGGQACFVIEADEYDTALFDKRSKFVHYRPRTAILNNLEFDHADIFADLAAIETQFHHLVRTVPSSGRLVVNARDEALARVLHAAAGARCSALAPSAKNPAACAHAARPHVLRRAARQPQAGPRRLAACWVNTTSSTRWPPSARPNTWAWRPRLACAALATLRERAPPARTARRSGRREGLRRLCAPPHGHAHHHRRPAPQGGPECPHPGRLRAALQHHEAGHDEGPVALVPGRGRPEFLPAGQLRLERGATRWRRWARRPSWPIRWTSWWRPLRAPPNPATTCCA